MKSLPHSEQSTEDRSERSTCLASGHGAVRLIGAVLAVLAITAVVESWPEIVRYLKLRNM